MITSNILTTPEYSFIHTNEHLKDNLILLGLGGSYAYGTNIETSDIDLRGISLNSRNEILLGRDFEQVEDTATDTVIYSFKKVIKLLTECNPNVIELLGLSPSQYLYMTDIGQKLIDNSTLFLSKRAIKTFGGYANQQLHRFTQLSTHKLSSSDLEKHIFKTLTEVVDNFKLKHQLDSDAIKLYIDKDSQSDINTSIFIDANFKRYPLQEYCHMWDELQAIIRGYNKLGKRNDYAKEHGKIAKHMMHLVRLYFMCIDLLEKQAIITYRSVEHDLLMDIRNGKYVTSNNQVTPEFYTFLDKLEKRLDVAKANTTLPDLPDYSKIDQFVIEINNSVILNT